LRAARLKKFPGIADPGVDRILLFAGIVPLPAVPSNCPHVLLITDAIPEKLDARIRACLLIKRHGQQICKRTNPKCEVCPVAGTCAFANRPK
jgi:endonuclease III